MRSKKTEGECIKTHSPSVKTFGFATSLSDGGIGLCNHSVPKLPIYIRREATPQLFTIHFSLFTRAATNPNLLLLFMNIADGFFLFLGCGFIVSVGGYQTIFAGTNKVKAVGLFKR